MMMLFRSKRDVAWPILALCFVAFSLAGCGWMSGVGFDAQSALGSVSLTDRCADFMRRAFPDTAIDVTDRQVTVDAETTVVAIAADRRDVPENGLYARKIGVECRFANGVLTGFRWTSGPIRSASGG
jgi:predicted small secreted protein